MIEDVLIGIAILGVLFVVLNALLEGKNGQTRWQTYDGRYSYWSIHRISVIYCLLGISILCQQVLMMGWKEDLIEKHPEWEYYYRSFDLWLEAREKMKVFDNWKT